jgi:hypothetical protein
LGLKADLETWKGNEHLTFTLPKEGGQIQLLRPVSQGADVIDHWVYSTGQRDNQSEGRAWDGGPSGTEAVSLDYQRVRHAAPYQSPTATFLKTTEGTSNHLASRNSFIVSSGTLTDRIYLRWSFLSSDLAVWNYSPKDHDNCPVNIEGIAYRPAGGDLANPEMLIGLRSPLTSRTSGNALYFRVNDVAAFLPPGGWTSAAAGILGPFTLDLRGQGIRCFEWCPQIGPSPTGRYLIIGGPANGGPLEKETYGEKFSLYSWDGVATTAPTLLIEDLRPYTTRPEGLAIVSIQGQDRILFAEDRYQSTGYGARNAVHWPISILPPMP